MFRILHGIQYGLKHELHERGGIPCAVAPVDRLVVLLLRHLDPVLHGDPVEDRSPTPQYGGLPQPGHPAVAVGEGMDEHQFVMEDARCYQGVHLPPGGVQPLEQVHHVPRDLLGRRCREDALVAGEHPLPLDAEPPGFLRRALGHDAVDAEQFLHAVGIEAAETRIRLVGVPHLFDILLRTDHAVSVDDIRYLF